MSKIKVVFRKFKEGDIIALFPRELGTNHPSTCMSYMHIGQHGSADPNIVSTTRLATPQEYAPLLKELRGLGYDLTIGSKITYDDYLTRRKMVRRTK